VISLAAGEKKQNRFRRPRPQMRGVVCRRPLGDHTTHGRPQVAQERPPVEQPVMECSSRPRHVGERSPGPAFLPFLRVGALKPPLPSQSRNGGAGLSLSRNLWVGLSFFLFQ